MLEIIICAAWFLLYLLLASDAKRFLLERRNVGGKEKKFLRTALSISIFFMLELACAWGAFPPLRQWLAGYIPALALTLVMEGAAAFVLGYRNRREFGAAILCSLVTHPALHVVVVFLFITSGEILVKRWNLYMAILETIVAILEYLILRRMLPEKGAQNAKLAIVMNLFSYLGGTLIFKLLSG